MHALRTNGMCRFGFEVHHPSFWSLTQQSLRRWTRVYHEILSPRRFFLYSCQSCDCEWALNYLSFFVSALFLNERFALRFWRSPGMVIYLRLFE
ncbi:hypothetical protein BCR33DRAFT_719744 [Rhizoclosmatium globosum]|uniref:Uncharacterized protein n=1 Tax=Rhizoclosmatium globosum TaxID=329046 RepID=A0A1Y2BYS9_9FUNG|nr:hypothetical protein BCR33DRAFT_719744 [Rhizoclosmatium globosum]|eukprot:ORY39932.1 hypothetical protein BCR33DRAFT_719744 [Rhizoclosmatium globosum]